MSNKHHQYLGKHFLALFNVYQTLETDNTSSFEEAKIHDVVNSGSYTGIILYHDRLSFDLTI